MDMRVSHIIALILYISALILSAGPLRSASVDIHCEDWRVRVMGDIGGWGTHAGSKEARVTLKHTVQGQTSPALQVRIAHTHILTAPSTSPTQILRNWIQRVRLRPSSAGVEAE